MPIAHIIDVKLYRIFLQIHIKTNCVLRTSKADDHNFLNLFSSFYRYQLFCMGPGVPYVRVKKFSDNNWNLYSDDQANIQYQDPSKQAQLLQKKSPWTQYTQVCFVFTSTRAGGGGRGL